MTLDNRMRGKVRGAGPVRRGGGRGASCHGDGWGAPPRPYASSTPLIENYFFTAMANGDYSTLSKLLKIALTYEQKK